MDLNHHECYPTGSLVLRVCQFRHGRLTDESLSQWYIKVNLKYVLKYNYVMLGCKALGGIMKYTIVTDSCCNLFAKDLDSSKIAFHVAPIILTVGDQEFIDDENLDTKNFIAKMKACKTHAKSACPSPEAFAKIMRENDNVIVLTLSSKLSGTYASAMAAAESVKEQFPDKKLFVLDSLIASAGQDVILLKLKELIECDKYNFDEITVKLAEIRSRTKVRFLLQDLTNLIKNGRLGKVVGTILNTLKVKLICGENGAGEIKKYGMAMSTKKGLASLAEYPRNNETDSLITIAHAHNEEDASFVKRLLESKFGFKKIRLLLMRGTSTLYASDKGIVIAY